MALFCHKDTVNSFRLTRKSVFLKAAEVKPTGRDEFRDPHLVVFPEPLSQLATNDIPLYQTVPPETG